MSTEEFIGGRVNKVVRIGATVRRTTGPHTAAVHGLLSHFATTGFGGAPRVHGIDEAGREILDYVPGDVPSVPWPHQPDDVLVQYGRLVRQFHDASSTFVPPSDAVWFLSAVEPVEVICHGDLAPDNCVFRDGKPVALIDFDVAHPGPRVWDLGYAACCFIPLRPPTPAEDPDELLCDQGRRLSALCDGYGLAGEDRAAVVGYSRARLIHLVGQIEEKAAAGHPAFVESLAAGHTAMFLAAADYIRANSAALEFAVSPST